MMYLFNSVLLFHILVFISAGNFDANILDYPFIIQIIPINNGTSEYVYNPNRVSMLGGVLVHPKWVLTINGFQLLEEAWTIHLKSSKSTQIGIKRIITKDMIALLELNDLANCETIKIAQKIPKYGQITTVVGWLDDTFKPKMSFKSVQRYVAHNDCIFSSRINKDQVFCLENNYNDTFCNFYSGSPVIADNELIGMQLYPYNCNERIVSQMYLNVVNDIGWIQNTTEFDF